MEGTILKLALVFFSLASITSEFTVQGGRYDDCYRRCYDRCYVFGKCFDDCLAGCRFALQNLETSQGNKARLLLSKDFSKQNKEDQSTSPEFEDQKDRGEKTAKKRRCEKCNKKVGLIGFKCRCGMTFCGTHRYAELHGCRFDYKAKGKREIAKANPVVKCDKLVRF